jgi:WD40 repeat protein
MGENQIMSHGNQHGSQEIINTYRIPITYTTLNTFYEFILVHRDGKYFLSDQCRTYEMLDTVFDLNQPDVMKNLVAILKEFGVRKGGKEFFIELIDWDENTDSEVSTALAVAKYKLFGCISFMDRMRIFYV